MDFEALKTQLIETEISNAILTAGGDVGNKALRDAIRQETLIVETDDNVAIVARLEGNTPRLSNRTPIADTETPMSLSELAAEYRSEGKHKDAFHRQKAEPATEQRSEPNAGRRGKPKLTESDLFKMTPGEMLHRAKQNDAGKARPNREPVKAEPCLALRELMKHDGTQKDNKR